MKPAVIRSRDEFVELLRLRRDELEITMETLDAITGLADGLSSKLLAPEPLKGMGPISLKALLGALALGIVAVVVVEDGEQAARMAPRWTKRKRPDYPKAERTQLGALLTNEAPDTLASTTEIEPMRAKQIQVRLEPELREKLEAEAARERRPLASLVRNILSDAVAPAKSDREHAA